MRSLPVSLRSHFIAVCTLWLALVGLCLPVDAALSLYVAPERLARQSPLVVEATVTDVRSGFDPDSNRLATYVTLDVDRTLRGPARLERVVVREAGGRWGELVHVVDAVPRYRAGERVVAFLEPSSDGALRTSAMFFGMFRIDTTGERQLQLRRDLDGRGLTVGRPVDSAERLSLAALRSLVREVDLDPARAAIQASSSTTSMLARSNTNGPRSRWHALPPEHARLLWNDRVHPSDVDAMRVAPDASATAPATPKFVALSGGQPTRWAQIDTGDAVTLNVRPAGNPLGSDAESIQQIVRGLEAWNAVPESRARVELGDTDFPYVELYSTSPVTSYSGVNIVLFDDPYDDIADPVGCAGVLAVGGYWRASGTGSSVNGIDFHAALQMYVVFSDSFECFLSDPDNLAEIAAHEIGHGLGFGHSPTEDALMRASAYGGRGPRLGDDDRDAAHCHYPHAVTITAPTDGASDPQPGEALELRWTPTVDASSAAGVVDIDYSLDGGTSWMTIAEETANDGAMSWVIPADSTGTLQLRVSRPLRFGDTPSGYPVHCTSALSESFELEKAPRSAADVAETRLADSFSSRRTSPQARGRAHGAGRAPSSSP